MAALLTLAMSVSLLAGCAGRTAEDEEEPIRVYLWTANLYEKYAPYVQAQLPDVDVEFVVGNNDLNFYKFLNENGELLVRDAAGEVHVLRTGDVSVRGVMGYV